MATVTSLPTSRGILPVDPSASPPAQIQDILPHILLFLFLILAYFPPPFRGRGILIWALIGVLEWRSITSAWPPNIGDTRPLRYGIASSWIFILPVLQRILIHTPERDFWRLDEVRDVPTHGQPAPTDSTVVKHPPPPPREFSWKKLRWSISLYCTPRAVGWNFGSRRINAQRDSIRKVRLEQLSPYTPDSSNASAFKFPRAQFVVTKITRAFICYLVWDVVMIANRKTVLPSPAEWWSFDREPMLRILWMEILMGITVYSGMNMQFDAAAAVGVGLGLNEPEDWPPLFGSITECYTIANVWGKFWHQYLRQPCLGFSHYLQFKLRTTPHWHINIPKHSPLTYLFHLTVAFTISTFFHTLSVGAVASGYLPIKSLIADMSLFFMVQPPAAILESAVGNLYQHFVLTTLVSLYPSSKNGGRKGESVAGGQGGRQHEQDVHANGNHIQQEQQQEESTSTSAGNNNDETVVTSEWEAERERQQEQARARNETTLLYWSAVFCRVVGYVWVFLWFYFTGRVFVRPYIGVGIIEWGLPFSFMEWLVLPEKC